MQKFVAGDVQDKDRDIWPLDRQKDFGRQELRRVNAVQLRSLNYGRHCRQCEHSVAKQCEHCVTNLRDTTVVRGPNCAEIIVGLKQTYLEHQVLLLGHCLAVPVALLRHPPFLTPLLQQLQPQLSVWH